MKISLITLLISTCLSSILYAQDDVMLQAFYWDVPVNETTLDGFWWDSLASKATHLSHVGFTGLWVPSPAKGNFGIIDMGYGIYDHYDLGNYNQKGTTETRFGSRNELENMISTMHNNGIEIYADIVLNHIYTDGDYYSSNNNLEANPDVKEYIFDEAYRNGIQYQSYPTNEITWLIPNASAGSYYIQIKGYNLDWGADKTQRGYDMMIDWTDNGPNSNILWENEPNNGGGNYNTIGNSGTTMQAHIESSSDVDEFEVTLNSTSDIVIKLTARKEGTDSSDNWEWQYADQNNGYYPVAIWYNSSNLANSSLEAQTATNINYPTHTGAGEANHSWNHNDFHPVDSNDWLGYPGSDEVITNTKFFGNDLNSFSSSVVSRLEDWGYWMADEIGFDGFRLDFVRGFQETLVADWVNNLPTLNGNQRFIVGEYWGGDDSIHSWVTNVANGTSTVISATTAGADVDAFDFPLKFALNNIVNNTSGTADITTTLDHASMARNINGNQLSGTQIVTFVDNHDTGKEHDKWVFSDWDMAYAYILTHEGRPCVFYSHYYGVLQEDAHGSTFTTQANPELRNDINNLIHIRKNYLGGSLEVLSADGNPYPTGDAADVYVARREGNGGKTGAIVVINDHSSQTKGLWVDHTTESSLWSDSYLVNPETGDSTYVFSDGRVFVEAPARDYAVYIPASEFSSSLPAKSISNNAKDLETNPSEFKLFKNYPNPFNPMTNITFNIPEQGHVSVNVYNMLGQKIATLADREFTAGKHSVRWEASQQSSGIYIYSVDYQGVIVNKKMTLVK
ncbi:MAG: alpha-amylase family glycosyl hydrolase [Balneolaceae bacterium]